MLKWLIIISTLFIVSCAPRMYINLNDKPIPNNYYKLQTTGDAKLDISLLFREYFIEDDKHGRVLASSDLSCVKENEVNSKNLVDVKLNFIIDNSTRRWYSVWEEFIIYDNNKIYPTKIIRQRYAGTIVTQKLVINIPTLKKGVVTTTIKLVDKTNYPILILNNINIIYN